jgi:hypothetical protein
MNAQQTAINVRLAKARIEAAPSSSPRIGRAYEAFLELPVAFVLVVVWVAGVALLSSCALVAYAVISALVGLVGGVF